MRRFGSQVRAVGTRLRMLAKRAFDRSDAVRYASWVVRNDTLDAACRSSLQAEASTWAKRPLVSVVIPLVEGPARLLDQAIDSVLAQSYADWELFLACGAADPALRERVNAYERLDSRIRATWATGGPGACEAVIALARGEFVAWLHPDDTLHAHALFELASAIRDHPETGLIYSDEDRITEAGKRFDPYFKPDYDYELLLGQNLAGHLAAQRRALLAAVGTLPASVRDAPGHDLVLRCIERLEPREVVHIARVLYHRRGRIADSIRHGASASPADIAAVRAHLARTCPGASVVPHPETRNSCRVRFPFPSPVPPVSIVIPTRNSRAMLQVCLDGIFTRTRYPSLEVIVVDNGSDDPALLDYLARLGAEGRARVLRDDGPFNYARLNNRAVALSTAEYVLLLNDDVEVVDPGWLEEMVSVAARPGVGAVGARLRHPDGTLQHAGVITGLGGVAGHAHAGLRPGDPGYFGRAVLLQNFSAATAACLLVRRRVFVEVGGFDEDNLAVAYNDVDFCLRIAQYGYRTVWTPHAELIHRGSASRGSDLAPEHIERFRSEIRFMQERWGVRLRCDPAFNINLSLDDPTFVLADAPRTGDRDAARLLETRATASRNPPPLRAPAA